MVTPILPVIANVDDVRRRASRAFTLLELLAVIAIVGILAGIFIAIVGRARAMAHESRCLANLRHLGTASALYSSEHRGALLPANWIGNAKPYLPDATTVFWCPSDDRVDEWVATGATIGSTTVSYSINNSLVGLATEANRWGGICYDRAKTLPLEITNPARKFMFLDAKSYYCRPQNPNADLRHRDRLNVVYADGHAGRFNGISEELYQYANWTP